LAATPLLFGVTAPIILASAYMLGSFPSAVLYTKIHAGPDIYQVGSGNPGATNIKRFYGWRGFFVVFVLDAAKGAIATAIATTLATTANTTWLPGAAATLAIAGHCFPFWNPTKGGKGVATFIGCMTFFNWPLGMVTMSTWVTVYAITKIGSLGSMLGLAAAGIGVIGWGSIWPAGSFLTAVALIVFQHRTNLQHFKEGQLTRIIHEDFE